MSVVRSTANPLLISLICIFAFTACSTSPKRTVPDEATLSHQLSQALAQEDCAQAAQALARLETSPQLSPALRLQTAYVCLQAGAFDIALAQAGAVRKLPDASHADYALYLYAVADYTQWQHSRLATPQQDAVEIVTIRRLFGQFRELATRFPESRYREQLPPYLLELREALARAELGLANARFAEQRYAEALARARYISEHFSRTQAHPYALALMFKSYLQLDQAVQAQQVRQTLEAQYPDHNLVNALP
ncbi:outer membrane protein assembly factor BamD [Thiorhodospira sibirica]|uniref:outer membrane protein assembly factor BamD n=1 Tax=Thiorhodospira sibirica TaxID=154347 RepID=UPI00022C58C3|nr:outer membrane protein assembly factor BamD [Thiorhodospira sibirica]